MLETPCDEKYLSRLTGSTHERPPAVDHITNRRQHNRPLAARLILCTVHPGASAMSNTNPNRYNRPGRRPLRPAGADDAFGSIPAVDMARLKGAPDAMVRFLSRHIIPGRYTATDLPQMREARTLGGDLIPVGATPATGGNLAAGGAEIVKSNIFAKNGVVHVLDRPVM